MNIQAAHTNDSEVLTLITKSSKAFWGYSSVQMERWTDILTITTSYIEINSVYKLVENGKILGYYSFFFQEEHVVVLDNLFVLPEHIGKGFGRFLMNDFLLRLKGTKAKKVVLESDPHAENFYAKLGFIKTSLIESSNKGRYLPLMELPVNR